MSDAGKMKWSDSYNNPHDLTGVIIEMNPPEDRLPISVMWSNKQVNSYPERDLTSLEKIKINDTVKVATNSSSEPWMQITDNGVVTDHLYDDVFRVKFPDNCQYVYLSDQLELI